MDPGCNVPGGSQQADVAHGHLYGYPADVTLDQRLWQLLANLHRDSERALRTRTAIGNLRNDGLMPETMKLQKTHCPPDVPQTRAQRLSYSTKKSLSKINLAKKPSKPKSKIRDHHEKVHKFYGDAFNERKVNLSPRSTRARRDYLQQRIDDLDKLHTERPPNASRYEPDVGYEKLRGGLQRRQQHEDWHLPDSAFRQEMLVPPPPPSPYRRPASRNHELFVEDGIRILMASSDPNSTEYKNAKKLLQDFKNDKMQLRRAPGVLQRRINNIAMRIFQNKLMAFYEDAYRQNDEVAMIGRNAAKTVSKYLHGVLHELETVNNNGPPNSDAYPLEYSFKRLYEALQRRIMEVEYRIPGGNIYRDKRTNAFILTNHKNNMKERVAGSVGLDPIHFATSSPTHKMGRNSPGWEVSGIFEFPEDPDEFHAENAKQNERNVYLRLLQEHNKDFDNTCELTTPEQVEKRIQYLKTRRRQVEAMLGNLPENAAEYDDMMDTNPRELIVRYNRLIAKLESDLM